MELCMLLVAMLCYSAIAVEAEIENTTTIPSFCQLPVDSGPCGYLIRKFYFNTNTKQCEKFYYGGCDGNRNRFLYQNNCEMTCHVQKTCPIGQVWNNCSSPCTLTCERKTKACITRCRPRCECPHDKPILHNGQCIEEQKCQTEPKGFKCWFGEVHSDTSPICYDPPVSMGRCPSNYVCVNTPYSGTQRACCPQGKDLCHNIHQLIYHTNPVLPPNCDQARSYAPKQCFVWGICTCSLPDGTYILKTVPSRKYYYKKRNICTWIENSIGREIFKCWFGKPLQKGESGCLSDYISVSRRINNDIVQSWEGCCPRGKGPCDEEKQRMETPGIIMDISPPKCDHDGNYAPMRCMMLGCYCVMPNGRKIKNSLQSWKDDNKPARCNDMVKNILGACEIGWWGHDCEKQCQCSTGESCDRLDGSSCVKIKQDKNNHYFVIVIVLSMLGVLFVFAVAFTIYCQRRKKICE